MMKRNLLRELRGILPRRKPRPAITITIIQSPDGTYEVTREPWPVPSMRCFPTLGGGSWGLTHRSHVIAEVRFLLREFEEEQRREAKS